MHEMIIIVWKEHISNKRSRPIKIPREIVLFKPWIKVRWRAGILIVFTNELRLRSRARLLSSVIFLEAILRFKMEWRNWLIKRNHSRLNQITQNLLMIIALFIFMELRILSCKPKAATKLSKESWEETSALGKSLMRLLLKLLSGTEPEVFSKQLQTNILTPIKI